jgi:16S rRNA (guanine527-N7)-methyltransferase
LPLAVAFGQRLATDGVLRGLIGPREVPRLWERHLLNCAVVTELVPAGARVVDVGSGAGLPGIAMACRRADLRVELVESLARRVAFLEEVVAALGLDETVRVVHGRAEDPTVRATVGEAEWVTARAVAPLERLVRWCLPLLRPGGTLLAIKGEQANAEVDRVRHSKGVDVSIVRCGAGTLDTPVTVVAVQRLRTRRGGD